MDVKALRTIVEAELLGPSVEGDLFVIDEIGKMELLCPEFVAAVSRLLDSPASVVATVALKGRGLIEEAKAKKDALVIEVTPSGRDGLAAELETRTRGTIALLLAKK